MKCRVLKDFPWRATRYKAGRIIEPHAQIRKLFLRRGLIEIVTEEPVAAKEQKAKAVDVAATVPAPKRTKKKVAVA